jgi:hypothetical protein
MHRSDLIEQITALAEAAEQDGERDAALVLFTLVLALGEGSDTELACFVALFAPKRPAARMVSAA